MRPWKHRERGKRAEEGQSLRTLVAVWAVGAGLVIALVAALIVTSLAAIHEAADTAAQDAASLEAIQGLETEFLWYARTTWMAASSGDESVVATRDETLGRIYALIQSIEMVTTDPAEHRAAHELRESIVGYVRTSRRLEDRAAPLETTLAELSPWFARTTGHIRTLRELRRRDLASSQDAVERLWIGASVAGVTAAVLLILSFALGHIAFRRKVIHPLEELSHRIRRYRGGDRGVRAQEMGPAEVRLIASAFNELSEALEGQRQRQAAYLAGVAHDLRTPLGAMKMAVDNIRDDREVLAFAEARSTFELIDRQFGRLNAMLSDLVDLTRIEAGEVELHMVEHDLRECAREIVDLYRPTTLAHRLLLEVPPQPVIVCADPVRTEEVVSNLVSNAIKYSPAGGDVIVSVGRTDREAVVAVQDSGVGVEPDQLAHIFQPFRRGRESGNLARGAGLGLSVVRRLVASHGGRIEVESQSGVGTTFRVFLPLAKQARAA